jgi:glycosyltransferase involved in cell wall biosynthesis
VRAADAIVAGNNWLRDQAIAAGARQGFVVPTCVNPNLYPVARHDATDPGVRLAWVGSASTLQGLERVRPHLEAIGLAVPGIRLRLICDQFLSFKSLPVEPCRWSDATEAAEIAAADIGISWLPDDAWSRGKCGLKVLQYMAAGLPVVANPVGVQADMVRHGESGLLATTVPEWIESIARLAGDAELRRRMGAAGRRRVEANFSVAVGSRLWRELLTALDRPARIAG